MFSAALPPPTPVFFTIVSENTRLPRSIANLTKPEQWEACSLALDEVVPSPCAKLVLLHA